jgi:DNA modification methylase
LHYRVVECADARALPTSDGQVSLIVTSPPYVTSYEYADLHQLTALWFEYLDSLPEFRQRFIGSAYSERPAIDLQSQLAEKICSALGDRKKGREVRNYFADMLECFQEMKRTLKVGGKACIVIGNTELQGVAILNAEVFGEQMQNLGFRTFQIVKREIPSKILPQTRDPNSGRFTSSANSNKVLAYPVEYILIMEKNA